jgi:quaternary ammonium compound-resistance protein SugE
MHWVFLILASAFEIGWVFSLKATEGFTRFTPIIFYACCGLGAAFFLSQAMRAIPTGTAYAIWVGLAIAGSNLITIAFLDEPLKLSKLLFIALILIGVVGLKVT